MTMRKFLFLNTTEGVSEEQSQSSDEITLAKVTVAGITGVGINMQTTTIANLGTPVNASDAATKAYVDSSSQGLSVKPSVRVLAASSVATLSGTTTIDGIALSAGSRVLLTAQTTASQNGIWLVQSGAWTRPIDFAAGGSAAGTFTFVEQGTVYASQGWTCTNAPGSDVIDTNALTYTQFTGTGEITAGNGITKTSNNLAVSLATNSGLQFTGSALDHLLLTGGGLSKGGSGLQVFINSTPSTLTSDTNGLRVTGLPSLFMVNGSAVDANVTAANLNTLNDGTSSIADALHNHNAVNGAAALQSTATIGATPCNAGDPVCWSSTANTLARGDAAADATSRIIGLCASAISASGSGVIVKRGVVTGCLSSATPGTPYWLASGGGLTSTVPTASGNRVIRVGFAKNATDLDVNISDMGKRS